MTERQILFTPENAQKCFEGRKTQTRRIVKFTDSGRVQRVGSYKNWHLDDPDAIHACPYGDVGDRLWVREAWAFPGEEAVMYQGNPDDVALYRKWMEGENYPKIKWKPSIHMPRWACRTVLEITAIRVEQVQAISQADAIAEGIEYHDGHGIGHSGYRHTHSHGYVYANAVEAYKVLWESINGTGSWAVNPWVWVITFKRVMR